MSFDVTTLALAKSYTNQHGGSGGQVQPDWNQNDSTASDYVKNRPFYTGDPVETVFVEENTIPFQFNGTFFVAMLESTFEATTGETYKVHWDGTIYESICTEFEGHKAIGNLSILNRGSDTGEPFFMQVENGVRIRIATLDTSPTHTISISQEVGAEVVKIDGKYMPEGYPKKSVGTVTLMEEQQVAFTLNEGVYIADVQNAFNVVEGQTYTVNWDGTEYECVGVISGSMTPLGNLSIIGMGDDTGEPFLYMYIVSQSIGEFGTLDTSASHTISVKRVEEIVTPMAEEFIPSTVTAVIENAATKENPVFTGNFSQNRKNNTTVGNYSFAEGYETTASESYSHAEGHGTTASGSSSHAEGSACTASGWFSHAEGCGCIASGERSHAEGSDCEASGQYSHAEGYFCTAQGKNQHVQGKFNIVSGTSDSIVDSDYAHIVGNGTSDSKRSNTHTLTWSGVPWYQGRPQFGGTAMDNGSQTVMANGDKEIILASSTADSTKKFRITVDDDYNVSATNTSDSVSKALATTEYVDNSVSNPLNITSAAVGQIAKITAVDDSGKPTAWEAVDMPSGGSSVPKPLTYDYMPEGYPTKSVGTITLMKEQEVAFKSNKGVYIAEVRNAFKVVEGQTYTVNWDGTEYECVGVISDSMTLLGNLSIVGMGDDTGKPFVYGYNIEQAAGIFATNDTSASHTISVKTTGEIFTPMAEEFLPAGVRTAAIIYNSNGNHYGSELTYDELYERLLDGKQVVLHRESYNEYLYLMGWMIKSNGDIDLTFGKNYTVTMKTDGTFVGVIA